MYKDRIAQSHLLPVLRFPGGPRIGVTRVTLPAKGNTERHLVINSLYLFNCPFIAPELALRLPTEIKSQAAK